LFNSYFNIIALCRNFVGFPLKLLGIFSNISSLAIKIPVKFNSFRPCPALECRSFSLFVETDVIRSLLRLFAYIALSLAIIAAVLDAARSVGASHVIMTSLQDSWQSISASSLTLAEAYVKTHIYPILWDPLMLWVLETPTFIVFALLAFLLYAMGYKRQNRVGRFAAR
jgi:hypothetical protein